MNACKPRDEVLRIPGMLCGTPMGETKTMLVQCTCVIPVEIPADIDDETMRRYLENECPGTGSVGAAFDAHMEKEKKASMCWACTSLLGPKAVCDAVLGGGKVEKCLKNLEIRVISRPQIDLGL